LSFGNIPRTLLALLLILFFFLKKIAFLWKKIRLQSKCLQFLLSKYHSMSSFQVITLLWYFNVNVQFLLHSCQEFFRNWLPLWFLIIIFNCCLAPTILPLSLWPLIMPTLLYIKCCPFINKQLCMDSFLDWQGHHWVCISILQVAASGSLLITQKRLLILENLTVCYSTVHWWI